MPTPRRPLPAFPDPRSADADGLLAIGGRLDPLWLLTAYAHGIFPWSDQPITWWSPDPRAVFELHDFNPPASLRRKLKSVPWRYTLDAAFAQVITACAKPGPKRPETWIGPDFIPAYLAFHEAGHAHSVEVWEDGQLIGGLYGVAIGGFFAGESMFHRVPDASKAALVHLFGLLQTAGYTLIDTQVLNPFTERLGAHEIPREVYLQRLQAALQVRPHAVWPAK